MRRVLMQAVADSIPQLVQGMRSSQAQPEELGAQLALIMASQSFLQVRFSPLHCNIMKSHSLDAYRNDV